jgi:hypothetical protein
VKDALVRKGVPAQAITVIRSGEIVTWISTATSLGSITRYPMHIIRSLRRRMDCASVQPCSILDLREIGHAPRGKRCASWHRLAKSNHGALPGRLGIVK